MAHEIVRLGIPTKAVKTEGFRFGGTSIGLMCGDAAEALRLLAPDTFDVIVTSPPYFWARDYGVDGQIGHEESVEGYIHELMRVFDELRRVLQPDGVFYLNIGDTYYSGNGQPHGEDPKSSSRNFMRVKLRPVDRSGWSIPKKSMIGIPWKVAFAMQDRGWTLRSDIIWNRLNAFVEPTARDRPHRQYEHVFLFSKSRFYSFDRDALGSAEDVWDIPIERGSGADHNAMFPAALVKRCIATGSPPAGNVLDPFVGSGTTVRVAAEMGRHGVGVELSPQYVDQFRSGLTRDGATRCSWGEVEMQLAAFNPTADLWRGNRRNFRKPRSWRSAR